METTEKNMEHGEHFNESIVNEVILEDMKKNRIDHMKYLPGMEVLEESDVMDQVISAMNAYDYDKYTEADVRRAPLPPTDVITALFPISKSFNVIFSRSPFVFVFGYHRRYYSNPRK